MTSRQSSKSGFKNRRDGVVVRASASQSVDLGSIPLVESHQKTLKMVSITFLLGAGHLCAVWGTSRQVRLLCPWARHLTGCPTFMWKTSGPEITTPKCGLTIQKHSDTSLSREWRINIANQKKYKVNFGICLSSEFHASLFCF